MIIDIGAGADASSISFMSAANKIITVLVSEPTSFADAYSLVKASYLDEKLDNYGIVWNMSNLIFIFFLTAIFSSLVISGVKS